MADLSSDNNNPSTDEIEWGVTYTDFCQAAINYYGSTDAFSQALSRGISAQEYANIFLNAGYTVESTLDGTITYIGYNRQVPYVPGSAIEGEINSNSQTGEYNKSINLDLPVATKGDGTPQGNVSEGSVKKYTSGKVDTSGATKILHGVGNVVQGGMAYSAGLNFGKNILSALYDADPDFWDAKGMENLDPATWGSIAKDIDNPAGKFAFDLLAGVRAGKDDEGNTTYDTTAYAQDVAQAYALMWLTQMGAFDSKTEAENTKFEPSKDGYLIDSRLTAPFSFYPISNGTYESTINALRISGGKNMFAYFYNQNNGENNQGVIISDSPFVCEVRTFTSSDWTTSGFTKVRHVQANDAHGEYYYCDLSNLLSANDTLKGLVPIMSAAQATNSRIGNATYSAANILFYNKNKTNIRKPLDGVENQPDGKVFDPSQLPENPTVQDFLDAINKQFPELQDNRIEIEVAQPDGSTKTITYYPIPIGQQYQEDNPNQPVQNPDNPNPQKDPTINPDTSTATQLATIIKILTDPETNPDVLSDPDTKGKPKVPTKENPPDTGTGDTPPVVLPVGHASSLWAIYNPTLEQINSFGSWLWSSDFVEQIKKLFNDPMQSIIGLHKVFATPVTGETRTIKVGYLDSGVSSLIVTDQYTTVDCGSVNLFEYFGNVFDYEPYTQLRLYLPFIGIVNLDTADVMRGTIHVVYRVDVLSGACLADVSITRDGSGGVLYQYSGSAAVTMPISSGSYIGIIANVIGIASSAISGFAKGGALGAIAGGASSLLSTSGGANVQHSGNFSGSSGAMGAKKPYIIVERPQTKLARNFEAYIGKPSNENTTLGACTGYVQVKECHLENVPATQQELNNIEQILKGGVLI